MNLRYRRGRNDEPPVCPHCGAALGLLDQWRQQCSACQAWRPAVGTEAPHRPGTRRPAVTSVAPVYGSDAPAATPSTDTLLADEAAHLRLELEALRRDRDHLAAEVAGLRGDLKAAEQDRAQVLALARALMGHGRRVGHP